MFEWELVGRPHPKEKRKIWHIILEWEVGLDRYDNIMFEYSWNIMRRVCICICNGAINIWSMHVTLYSSWIYMGLGGFFSNILKCQSFPNLTPSSTIPTITHILILFISSFLYFFPSLSFFFFFQKNYIFVFEFSTTLENTCS